MKITYKDSGVDVTAGYEAVKLMKEHVKKTFNDGVLTDIGSFGGMYDLKDGNVLIAGTDGVGTKLKVAFTLDRHDTVGIDCVAMCVNDIVCHGARPLFFLDYIATGRLKPEKIAQIVKGVADGCCQAGCALIGGETAEMPGFYQEGEYDMAGFAVGIVKKDEIINGENIKAGDALIGLKSSGVHSNGFSLVRRVLPMRTETMLNEPHGFEKNLGETLLEPTKIYVKTVLDLIGRYELNGIAHITGGGFIENVPRMLPDGLTAVIKKDSYEIPKIFKLLIEETGLEDNDAYNTFNMGIGMVIAVAADKAGEICKYINDSTDDEAVIIGSVEEGSEGVILK